MKKELFTTLLILALFVLIIAIGCGGGGNDGITSPSSLNNANPTNNNNEPPVVASITIKIKWPELADSMIESIKSSGIENNLNESLIPYYTTYVMVKVFEYNDENPSDLSNLLAFKAFDRDITEETVDGTIENIPAVKVTIVATAIWGSYSLLSGAETIQLKVDTNNVPIEMDEIKFGEMYLRSPDIHGFIMIPDEEWSPNFRNKDRSNVIATLTSDIIKTSELENSGTPTSINTQAIIDPYPDDPYPYETVPLPGHPVVFEISSGNAVFVKNPAPGSQRIESSLIIPPDEDTKITRITDEQGNVEAAIICSENCGAGDTVTVNAAFYDGGNLINFQITDIPVTDNLIFRETFDGYSPQTHLSELYPTWGFGLRTSVLGTPPEGHPAWNLHESVNLRNIIDNSSAHLYAQTDRYAFVAGYPGDGNASLTLLTYNPLTSKDVELRIHVENGTEDLEGQMSPWDPSERLRGVINFATFKILSFTESGIMLNWIGESVGTVEGTEYRFQVIDRSNSNTSITYYLNEAVQKVYTENYRTSQILGLSLESQGGSVLYDEIEIFSLDGLPRNSD